MSTPGNMQVMWLRSALNEKETELLEVRDQHQRLLVSMALHTLDISSNKPL